MRSQFCRSFVAVSSKVVNFASAAAPTCFYRAHNVSDVSNHVIEIVGSVLRMGWPFAIEFDCK